MQTQPSMVLADVATKFLHDPNEANEAIVLASLNASLQASGFDSLPDGFIEWGCVEHGVVHICAFEGQQWIEVDPKTGVAVAL